MTCRRHNIVGPSSSGFNNDVIVCGNAASAESHVIFFGGDVQDYPEKMESHRDNKRYIAWNLENTTKLLYKKFPDSLILVIRPNRMHLNTFSVYSNFVESNDFGVPNHTQSSMAWWHLKHLYNTVVTNEMQEHLGTDKFTNNQVPLKIIGFSKGCIVLNQMLYGLTLALETEELKPFVEKVEEFYWMDGGHCGGSKTWVCDTDVLSDFAKLNTKIFVHVTPYQVNDPMRTWVGTEQRKFVSKLSKLGASIVATVHFKNEQPSLENHFNILQVL